FTAEDRGATRLYVVPASGGAPKPVTSGGSIAAFAPGAGFAVVATSTLTSPAELFRVGADGTSSALTRENAEWRSATEMAAPESLTAVGAAGARVQYWLLKPPGFDPARKYPVVFLIHGGPQGAWLDGWSSRWNPALWAAQGWIVAAPNPRGST